MKKKRIVQALTKYAKKGSLTKSKLPSREHKLLFLIFFRILIVAFIMGIDVIFPASFNIIGFILCHL